MTFQSEETSGMQRITMTNGKTVMGSLLLLILQLLQIILPVSVR